ncbi:CapA family protein [Paenibacillus sp. sgz302251]|uniref:CapA family protein n=1 Tax=Paenibacillus sp. sgz302251 TaxID=3414493 RepID=UPI003C7CCCB8
MYASRSESHQQDKQKRKRRLRRLVVINLSLLGVIAVLLGGYLAAVNFDKLQNFFSFSGGSDLEQAAPAQGDGANAGAGNESSAVEGAESLEEDPLGAPTNSTEDAGMPDEMAENGAAEPAAGSDAGDKVNLAFVGDILVGEYVSAITQREGYDFLYQPSLLYLSEPDLTAGNLEYPVTTRGVPVEGTPYVFKGLPETLPSIRNAGFDVMSLANNHALDQGVEGMLDTMKHLDEAGISHMGAGSNDTEAFTPVIKEVRGVKIAYIGLSRVVPFVSWKADRNIAGVAETYETKRAVAAISKAKEQADIVVVMVHWGEERTDQPLPYQKDFGRQYIDAGADLVIGSHPHVLQGFEMYKGKWIAYSLGNFIFTSYPKKEAGETGVLDASCTKDGDCDLKFHPMFTVEAQPTPMEAEAGKALLERLTSISFDVQLREDGVLVPN